jgi:hypothetical protein
VKHFKLLWRGSRDSFTADEFHLRCNGRPNTLTLIQDTKGNVFGDFTPVEWASPALDKFKGDDSLRIGESNSIQYRQQTITLTTVCEQPIHQFES